MTYELLSQSMTLNKRGGRNRSGGEEGVGKLFKKKNRGDAYYGPESTPHEIIFCNDPAFFLLTGFRYTAILNKYHTKYVKLIQ